MWRRPFSDIRYESHLITFTEVPDEISLCFNITGCPNKCEGCFEPWLAEDTGDILSYDVIENLYKKHPHITCICFMGGDRYYDHIAALIMTLRRNHPRLKFAIYSGRDEMNPVLEQLMDYYKTGPYKAECGPLDSPTTNQRFYKKVDGQWLDITNVFQKEKI